MSSNPGERVIGNDPDGFYRPALMTYQGTSVTWAGQLPTTVSLDIAPEIRATDKRINGAFKLSPSGMQFGGTGAMLGVEFSEDDVALFGVPYSQFRAVRLTYPANYPTSKETATWRLLLGQSAPVLVRTQNGKRIYGITAPIASIDSTYGAIPASVVSGVEESDRY